MTRLRRKRASAIAFSAVLALVLVVLGVGFFFFSMYMGAQNETKNATDAGALNVGKQALSADGVTYTIAGDDKEEFFRDVTGGPTAGVGIGDGKVNLTNIDRVWGKALFVAINSDAAGSAAGDTTQNVQSAQEGAQSISDQLSAKLTDEANLHGYFEEYSKQNSTRMIGTNTSVSYLGGPQNWQTSLMDRNKESNIEVTDNLPVGYNLPTSDTTATTRNPVPSGANGKTYLKGYTPLTVANQTFWQVPYQFDQKPHLVSKTLFDADKQPPNMLASTWDKAVPNAFSVGGQVDTKPGVAGEKAMAWVQTNPRKVFPLQFPNGFVRVVVKKNDLQWRLDFIPMDSTTYESSPGTTKESGDGVPYPIPFICATVSGTAYVGNEYLPPTLYFAVVGNAPPDTSSKSMEYILQRCKEMVPGYTMGNLITAMSICPVSMTDEEQTFYIYPNLVANPIVPIIATPDSLTVLPLGCDKTASPEGSEEWSDSIGPMPTPNFALETFTCNGVPAPDIPMDVTLTIEHSWKPGTGYAKGCLGELTVHHQSDALLFVLPCTCPV